MKLFFKLEEIHPLAGGKILFQDLCNLHLEQEWGMEGGVMGRVSEEESYREWGGGGTRRESEVEVEESKNGER